MSGIILYHGSKEILEFPEIRMAKFNKDFYFGFYCTQFSEMTEEWLDFIVDCRLGV